MYVDDRWFARALALSAELGGPSWAVLLAVGLTIQRIQVDIEKFEGRENPQRGE